MKHLTEKAWNRLALNIINYVTQGKGSQAILAVLQEWFHRAGPGAAQKKATPAALAGLLFETATERRGSMENITVALEPEPDEFVRSANRKPLSQRTVWRYWLDDEEGEDAYKLEHFQRDMMRVCNMFFQLARKRFRLFGKKTGFDVLIDEHQTVMYVKRPIRSDKTPHPAARDLSAVSSASKQGEYVQFRALTYECMIAVCRRTGVAIPLAVMLVCPKDRALPPGLRVPDMGKVTVIDTFIGLLETMYAKERPWLLAFDRGYHANLNYARVIRYCNRRGTVFLTPAKRESGQFMDDAGNIHRNVTAFMKYARSYATQIPGTNVYYVVTRKAVRNEDGVNRYLVVFYRPPDIDKEDRADPESVQLPDGSRVFGFYTNYPYAGERISVFERLYSRRWEIEHYFATRKGNFNGGRQHDPFKRVCVFMVGIVSLCVYGLMRGVRYPVRDVRGVSRDYNVPLFVRQVHEAVVRRRQLGPN